MSEAIPRPLSRTFEQNPVVIESHFCFDVLSKSIFERICDRFTPNARNPSCITGCISLSPPFTMTVKVA